MENVKSFIQTYARQLSIRHLFVYNKAIDSMFLDYVKERVSDFRTQGIGN